MSKNSDDIDESLNEPKYTEKKTEEMLRYEKDTGKYAIWRGIIAMCHPLPLP